MRIHHTFAAIMLLSLISAGVADAKPKPQKSKKSPATKVERTPGKEEFEKGQKYFEAEEYEAALPFFKKAYELSGKRPATIFSLAQCERAVKRYDDAITHFREYLSTTPRPPDATDVEQTLELLTELAADQKRKEEEDARRKQEEADRLAAEEARRAEAARNTPPALPPPAPPPPEEPSFFESPVFLGVAGALVIAGGVIAVVAASGEADPYGGNTRVILGK